MSSTLALLLLTAVVRDDAHGFSFDVPKGYERAPQPEPPALYAFTRGQPEEPGFVTLTLVDMGGTIGQDSELIHSEVEASARRATAKSGVKMTKFDYRKVKWKSFDLDLLVSTAEFQGETYLSLATQVPLKHRALQLQLATPAPNEAAAFADLDALLASIEGETNWRTDAERSRDLGRMIGTAVGVLGALIAGVVLTVRSRRRATPARP